MRIMMIVAAFVLLNSCTAAAEPPHKTLTDLQKLIHIPEPVTISVINDLTGFDPANFKYNHPKLFIVWDAAPTSQWHIYATQEWIKSTDHRDRVFGISHELCHAMYDYDAVPKWGSLSKADRNERQKRASKCADQISSRYRRAHR